MLCLFIFFLFLMLYNCLRAYKKFSTQLPLGVRSWEVKETEVKIPIFLKFYETRKLRKRRMLYENLQCCSSNSKLVMQNAVGKGKRSCGRLQMVSYHSPRFPALWQQVSLRSYAHTTAFLFLFLLSLACWFSWQKR